MATIKTSVYNGYRIQETTEIVNIETAVELLKTDRQITVSTAKRVEDNTKAVLASHVLICPYCGHEIPAYARYVNEPLRAKYPEDELRTDDEIDEWGAIQLSFYNPSTTILLNRVCRPTQVYKCPNCRGVSHADERQRTVAVHSSATKVEITCEILNLSELTDNLWYLGNGGEIKLPAYERLTFDVKRGKVRIAAFSEDFAKAFATCDVSEMPDNLKKTVAWRVLKSNKNLAEVFRTEFEKVTKSKIPYFAHELNLEKYTLMTRFVGYDRSFYDGIPFDEEKVFTVEESFKEREKALHTAQDAIRLVEEAKIPHSKSVRRLFFREQGLLFYIAECEALWDVFKNVDYFCELLQCRRAFEILSSLHHRPKVIEFLKEKASLHNPVHLVKEMMVDWSALEVYIAGYLALSDYAKKKEQSFWKGSRADFFERGTKYSRPICVINPKIENCEINGYIFFWLRNTADYARCGRELSNCLSMWRTENHPVICVEYEGRIHAAIEISPRGVSTVLGEDNVPLTDDERFQEALSLWMERFDLKHDTDEGFYDDDDDDYDNLPF